MFTKGLKSVLVVSLFGTVFTGCSSLMDATQLPYDEAPPLTVQEYQDLLKLLDKRKENEAMLAEWKQSKEGVKRLLALESDLKTLIEQLSQLTDSDSAEEVNSQSTLSNNSSAHEQAREGGGQTTEKNVDKEMSTNATYHANGNTVFFIQLTAMNNIENIASFWKDLTAKQPGLLGNLLPLTEKVQLPGGEIYRLKAGTFNALADANDLCNELRTRDVPCIVSHYSEDSKLVPLKLN